MVEQSVNLNDFLLLVPCCAVALFLALAVGGVLFMVHLMGTPEQARAQEPGGRREE
jgi:hypothetical protein